MIRKRPKFRLGRLSLCVGILFIFSTTVAVDRAGSEPHRGFLKSKSNYLSIISLERPGADDRVAAADYLYWMIRFDQEESFPYILDALDHSWPELRKVSSFYAGYYFMNEMLYSEDTEWLGRDWSITITGARAQVMEKLLSNIGESCWDVSVPAIMSLARMGSLKEQHIELLCRVLSGRTLTRILVCDFRSDLEFDNLRKQALGTLTRLQERTSYRLMIEDCFQSILDEQAGSSDPLLRAIERNLDPSKFPLELNKLEQSDQSCGGGLTYDCSPRDCQPYDASAAVAYAEYWYSGFNSIEPLCCDPFKVYVGLGGDCANFVSQCVFTGGFVFHSIDGCAYCLQQQESSTACCRESAEKLAFSLRNHGSVVSSPDIAMPSTLDYAEVQALIPADFGPGDVAILGISPGTPEERYGHSLICVDGTGPSAVFNAHSASAEHKTLYYYQDAGFDIVDFYKIRPPTCVVGSTWGGLKAAFAGYAMLSSSGLTTVSSTENIIAWNLPDSIPDGYYVLRANRDDEDFLSIGLLASTDTTFIDSNAVAGEYYSYKVAAFHGDSLLVDLGTSDAGLKHISTVSESAAWPYETSKGLQAYNQNLYVAWNHVIQKYDISDPSQPTLTTSRSFSFSWIEESILSADGNRIYILEPTRLHVYQTSTGFPDWGTSIVLANGTGDEVCWDLSIAGDIAIVTRGSNGLVALDLTDSNLPVVETYHGPQSQYGWRHLDAEYRNGYLYTYLMDLDPGRLWPHNNCAEILKLNITSYPQVDCEFELVCTSDDPTCWSGNLRWIGYQHSNPDSRYMVAELYDANQNAADDPIVIVDMIDPEYPTVSKYIDNQYMGWLWINAERDTNLLHPLMYGADFDGSNCFLTTPMIEDQLGRGAFAYNFASDDQAAVFATGGLEGWTHNSDVDSYQNYLFVADAFRPTEGETTKRIRVFEKANGCSPDSESPIQLAPEESEFNLGENIGISWSVGCPANATLELFEDGALSAVVSSFIYPSADNVPYHTRWTVSGISSDLENHIYQIRVSGTDLDTQYYEYFSDPFTIAIGNTYEVDNGGGRDFTSIQAAINQAASGDTIFVYGGPYTSSVALRSNIHVLTAGTVYINPPVGTYAFTADDLVNPPTVSGFTIDAGYIDRRGVKIDSCGANFVNCNFVNITSLASGPAARIEKGYPIFTNCLFNDVRSTGGGGGAVYITGTFHGDVGPQFIDCKFIDCQTTSQSANGGAVKIADETSYNDFSAQPLFTNCEFRGNRAAKAPAVRIGMNTWPSFEYCTFLENAITQQQSGDGIISSLAGAGATFTNCTFAGSIGQFDHDVLYLRGLSGYTDPVVIHNCIFANNSNAEAIAAGFTSDCNVSTSVFYGNHGADQYWISYGVNNLNIDPQFCDADNGDYSLFAQSICIPGFIAASGIGALSVGCTPPGVVTASPQPEYAPGIVFACPQGDAASVSITCALDSTSINRDIASHEFAVNWIESDFAIYDHDGLFPASMGASSSNNYTSQASHSHFGGNGTGTGVLTFNGIVINDTFYVSVRTPDTGQNHGGDSDGVVDLLDLTKFASAYTSPPKPYDANYDVNGDSVIDVIDFSLIAEHYLHHTALPRYYPLAPQSETVDGLVDLILTEEFITPTERRLNARITVVGVSPFKAMCVAFKLENANLRFREWKTSSSWNGTTIATPVSRNGIDEVFCYFQAPKYPLGLNSSIGTLVFDVLTTEELVLTEDDFTATVSDLLLIQGSLASLNRSQFNKSQEVNKLYHNTLAQNYPNPFNPSTTVKYSTKTQTQVHLNVYNVHGQLVKTLVNEYQRPGVFTIVWSGENNQGQSVASGVYFYRLVTGDYVATKKMVLLK